VEPEIKFARLGSQRIAYQVLGQGPVDLILTLGRLGSIEGMWFDPAAALYLQRLAGFSRLIQYDALGTGSSDPVPLDSLPPLEASVDELLAVMDAARVERAVLMGSFDGGSAALVASVVHPDRVLGLILMHSPARLMYAEDYPMGLPQHMADALDQSAQAFADEGSMPAQMMIMLNPSRATDPEFPGRMQKLFRSVAGPSAMRAYLTEMLHRDVRSVLSSVQMPTLILHKESNALFPVAWGHYLEQHIADAELVVLPGADISPFWEKPEISLDAIRAFLSRLRPGERPTTTDRVVATVLFTDIVSSTERAAAGGDANWLPVLQVHDELSRRIVGEHAGKVVKTTGDGIMARFESPGRGLLAARALVGEMPRLGLQIRAGLHTGEVQLRGDDLGGIAVHIAARVAAAAGSGEVLVSRTVKDLVVGSEFIFEDMGTHPLKGIEGEWDLFALIS
jgi:class 3 adenylate cyclase